MNTKCEDCSHWKFRAECDKKEKPSKKCCSYWTLARHMGNQRLDFDEINSLGPETWYEGWAKVFALGITNFCIITDKNMSCGLWRDKNA